MIPVNVTIQYLHGGVKESRQVRLAMEDTVQAVIDKLLHDLDLDSSESYQLLKLRAALDDDSKLYEAGVQEGDILQLVRHDPNATVIGKIPSGNILSRLGGKGGGEPLPVMAQLVAPDGTTFRLRRTRAMIGRADATMGFPSEALDADLTALDHRRTVSRPHALIVYQDGVFLIRDLYSQFGVILNGTRITANTAQRLKDGDSLRFGDVALVFHCAG